jgi:hypothetical protein
MLEERLDRLGELLERTRADEERRATTHQGDEQ